jgi:vacuolar-type H+-ATPase subunit H
MTSRDEYLSNLKSKLDEWDKEIDSMEKKARDVQAEAQNRFEKQVSDLREMRNQALDHYREMQEATMDAWGAMAEAAEKSWQNWLDAFDHARTRFREDAGGPKK